MTTKRWRDLCKGDTVVCPTSGQPERVTFARRGNPGRWFVRTENHDHARPMNETVEVVTDN